jgi:hypothetical protein
MVEHQRDRNQHVLEPLMDADRLENGNGEIFASGRSSARFIAVAPSAGCPVGRHDDGAACRVERRPGRRGCCRHNRNPPSPHSDTKPVAFAAGGEIFGIGGMQDAIKQAEMIGNGWRSIRPRPVTSQTGCPDSRASLIRSITSAR